LRGEAPGIAAAVFNLSPSAHPYTSAASLEQRFADGLAEMLETRAGLGVYILVLANAACDSALWPQLAPALAKRRAALAAELADTLRRGGTLAEPDERRDGVPETERHRLRAPPFS
jgi:hypothetical protein